MFVEVVYLDHEGWEDCEGHMWTMALILFKNAVGNGAL